MSIESDVREGQQILLALSPEQRAAVEAAMGKMGEAARLLDVIPERLFQVIIRLTITIVSRRATGFGTKGLADKILAGGDQIFAGREQKVRETVRALLGQVD